ncbi:glycosyltransferase [Nocardioides sp.]|uniref:glycosyltransferase n=1 Tax=Nocardioides sp. TaxID=35761 RepID=UPI002611D71B|nr:glycosyltransferase [Nocardioides sp.]
MLGTRGVPAAHGGFETAVENIGLELVARGWKVVVYCQDDDPEARTRTDEWKGIERVWLPARYDGAKGTMWFDAQAIAHAARHRDLCVTFGYNTAMLNLLLRLRRVPQVINMDGIEWKRRGWTGLQRIFLYAQERAGCWLGNELIADHPVIADHLATRVSRDKIVTIAYGAPSVRDAPRLALDELGLTPGGYLTLVARPVPENSILEMVRAFSSRRWGKRLVVVGTYDASDPYHRQVLDAASDEVDFVGAIYDPDRLQALRYHSLAYLHGHTVGGTNPSLVEALGCANPVIAHDNPYNRWVAGTAALYVRDEVSIVTALERVIGDPILAMQMSAAARIRHTEEFSWSRITDQYEGLFERLAPRRRSVWQSAGRRTDAERALVG